MLMFHLVTLQLSLELYLLGPK